jgi:hypothetical protein
MPAMHEGVRFTKTEAGRGEIKTRARKLAPTLRSLLLLIDGQRDVAQLRQVMAALHAPPDALEQLVALDLIAEVGGTGPVSAAPVPLSAGAHRYGVLYALLSDTVAEHLGLRGYFTQLKIERCSNADELAAMLPDLHVALRKARGAEFADAWEQRMQALARV